MNPGYSYFLITLLSGKNDFLILFFQSTTLTASSLANAWASWRRPDVWTKAVGWTPSCRAPTKTWWSLSEGPSSPDSTIILSEKLAEHIQVVWTFTKIRFVNPTLYFGIKELIVVKALPRLLLPVLREHIVIQKRQDRIRKFDRSVNWFNFQAGPRQVRRLTCSSLWCKWDLPATKTWSRKEEKILLYSNKSLRSKDLSNFVLYWANF